MANQGYGAYDPSHSSHQGLVNYELYNENLEFDIRDKMGQIEFYHKSCEWMSYSYWNNNIRGYERYYR